MGTYFCAWNPATHQQHFCNKCECTTGITIILTKMITKSICSRQDKLDGVCKGKFSFNCHINSQFKGQIKWFKTQTCSREGRRVTWRGEVGEQSAGERKEENTHTTVEGVEGKGRVVLIHILVNLAFPCTLFMPTYPQIWQSQLFQLRLH